MAGRPGTTSRPTSGSSSSTAPPVSHRRPRRSPAPTRSPSTSPSDAGKWSIAYDEFGYAKVYGGNAAWIENQSGKWVLPYAENISAALDSATLRPDLSQELSGVYRSPNPLAYPISAYSYMVTQCETTGDRPSCRGNYSNPGVAGTLSQWLRYIACEGQVRMAQIGYSPLPPNLSQEVANSIARLNGTAPETLNAGNCANPRFSGSLGVGASSPPDPYLNLPGGPAGPGPLGGPQTPGDPTAAGTTGGTAAGGTSGSGSTAAGASGSGSTAAGASGSGSTAAGASGDLAAGRVGAAALAVGGGSTAWRTAEPVAYPRAPAGGSAWPLVILLLALAVPVVASSVSRRGRLDSD